MRFTNYKRNFSLEISDETYHKYRSLWCQKVFWYIGGFFLIMGAIVSLFLGYVVSDYCTFGLLALLPGGFSVACANSLCPQETCFAWLYVQKEYEDYLKTYREDLEGRINILKKEYNSLFRQNMESNSTSDYWSLQKTMRIVSETLKEVEGTYAEVGMFLEDMGKLAREDCASVKKEYINHMIAFRQNVQLEIK